MNLALLWYIVLAVSLIMYAVLDGFDLGVGILKFFMKNDLDQRVLLNAIGPVWDGNEVWFVIVGGALFAGFPGAFASIFSAFYIPTILLVAALVLRAVSIEFRSKHPSPIWRKAWDFTFASGSLFIAFATGAILGNLIEGVALTKTQEHMGSAWEFFRPYPILCGISSIFLFSLHGGLYLLMKTEGALYTRISSWIPTLIKANTLTYLALILGTIIFHPWIVQRFLSLPYLLSLPIGSLLLVLHFIPSFSVARSSGKAFISSCLHIAMLLVLFTVGSFPYLLRSTVETEIRSLTVFNAAASDLTLTLLLIIAGLGVPLVLAYGSYVYYVFRGKVKINKSSY